MVYVDGFHSMIHTASDSSLYTVNRFYSFPTFNKQKSGAPLIHAHSKSCQLDALPLYLLDSMSLLPLILLSFFPFPLLINMPSDPSFDQALYIDSYENDPYRNRRLADHCKTVPDKKTFKLRSIKV
jgi:hypothetical protein